MWSSGAGGEAFIAVERRWRGGGGWPASQVLRRPLMVCLCRDAACGEGVGAEAVVEHVGERCWAQRRREWRGRARRAARRAHVGACGLSRAGARCQRRAARRAAGR